MYDTRVLITGGAGFIGSNLLKTFVKKYPSYYFICIDKLNYASHDITKDAEFIQAQNFEFIKLDLCVTDTLLECLQKLAITDIIHLAAESCVDRSFNDPLYFTKNNILSTQNLLEYIRLSNRDIRFVHISTDEVYGEQTDNSVDENDNLNPTNPYSASKAAVDLIIKSYEYSYGIKTTIIRSNNVYGPNQFPEKIIPMILCKLKANERIQIHGTGINKRNYLYISDFIDAVDLLWNKPLYGIYNIGSPYEIDNLSLAKLIIKLLNKPGDPSDFIEFVKDRNYNDFRYAIRYSKLSEIAGWYPKVNLEQGLANLIDQLSDL